MRRREVLGFVGSVAATWPVMARAQQPERVRRIGVFMNFAANDPEGLARLGALLQGLQERGWTVGRNLQIDYRWGAGNSDQYRDYARELVAHAPDVIVSSGGTVARAVQSATRAIPLVFAQVTDPVGGGLVASLARPGGNATGFTQSEYGMGGKWLELLRQVAPQVKRVAVIRDPTNPAAIGQFAAIQAVAPMLQVELTPIDSRDAIEQAITDFARTPNGGMIIVTGQQAVLHRAIIISLADRFRLPTIYFARFFVADGGLLCYGPDTADPFRRAADYVDRILKGEKAADLPVQTPTKYGLVVNLKSAKALGIVVPPSVLARADEVIE